MEQDIRFLPMNLTSKNVKTISDFHLNNNTSIKKISNFVSPTENPSIIQSTLYNWEAKDWTFEHLYRRCGSTIITANKYSKKEYTTMLLGNLIDTILSEKRKNIYLQDWWYLIDHPDMINGFEIPTPFLDDIPLNLFQSPNSNLWVGSSGAATFLHQDALFGYVWSTQIVGVKRWILIDSSVAINFNIPLERFIQNNIQYIHIVDLHPGDTLVIPPKWWHGTYTLEACISLSNFYIPPKYLRQYILDILRTTANLAIHGEKIKERNPFVYRSMKDDTLNLIKILKIKEALLDEGM